MDRVQNRPLHDKGNTGHHLVVSSLGLDLSIAYPLDSVAHIVECFV